LKLPCLKSKTTDEKKQMLDGNVAEKINTLHAEIKNYKVVMEEKVKNMDMRLINIEINQKELGT
jgi:hypothetical protein